MTPRKQNLNTNDKHKAISHQIPHDSKLQHNDGKNDVSLFKTFISVLSAGLGVQTNEIRCRDFKHGSPKLFLLAGLISTLAFVALLVLLVNLAIQHL